MRVLFALVKYGLLLAVALGAGVLVLVQFFGLRMELGGSGMTPVFSFYDAEAHYRAIEEDRKREAARLAEVEERPAAAAAPAEAPSVEEAARVAPRQSESAPEPEQETTAAPPAYRAPWPGFRGSDRDGVASDASIRVDWPAEGLREIWRQRIGGGYASMSVAEGKVFTIEQRREQEVVAAYDVEIGVEVWESGWPELFEESMGGPGPRATPTWYDGKVYALGAAGEFRCLDSRDGSVVWRTNILEDAGADNRQFGMPGSPLIYEGNVIVTPGGANGKAAIAYDAQSGEVAWQAQSFVAGYASPVIRTLARREQLLIVGGDTVMGLDPHDGALLWRHPWEAQYEINAAQPIAVDADHVWLSSSYGKGAVLLKVGGEGVETVWERNTMKNSFGSAVLRDGSIYGFDGPILACIDARTGERKWKGGRYGYGQLLLAGDYLIVLSEKGDVVLVEATPEEHREIARFSALSGKTWSVPVIADGKLIVRNQTEMAAYALRE